MKRVLRWLVVVCWLVMAGLKAADMSLPDGSVLQNYRVNGVEANGLKIIHSTGATLVDFDDLPADLRKKYGWSEERSTARAIARVAEAARLRAFAPTTPPLQSPATKETPSRAAVVAPGQAALAVEAIASLANPEKLATLGVRGANARVQKITYWLWVVRESGGKPTSAIDDAFARFGWKGTLAGEVTKMTMLTNLNRADFLGCFDEEGVSEMRRGRSPTIKRGTFTGDQMSVDHVIPRAVVEELDNSLANLELMPLRMNVSKSAKLEPRQQEFARLLVANGMLSAERVPWAAPFPVKGLLAGTPPKDTKSATAPRAPPAGGFMGSSRSEVFHKASCASVAKIVEGNLVSYGSRDEAVQAGKRPCPKCNP